MKKIEKRILGYQVFLAEKYRPGELALTDVTPDRGDVFVEKFGYFLDRVEAEIKGHCSPMNFLILYRVLPWGFKVLPLMISATAVWDILRNIATCWSVRSLSRINSLNLDNNLVTSGFCIVNSTLMQKHMRVKHYFKVF